MPSRVPPFQMGLRAENYPFFITYKIELQMLRVIDQHFPSLPMNGLDWNSFVCEDMPHITSLV